MDADWSWWRFWWGALGAAAPEIVRLYQIVTKRVTEQGRLTPLKFSRTYFIVSPLFFVVGGAVASGWGDNNAMKCFYLGVSLPFVVSSAAKIIRPDRPEDGPPPPIVTPT